MKIKCINLIDKYTGLTEKSDDWATVGRDYFVLGLYFGLGEVLQGDFPIQITFEGDMKDQPSRISDPSCFEIVENIIPSNFGIYMNFEMKNIIIQPRSWYEYKSPRDEYSQFWDDFYDEERVAVELYRKELARIKGESYIPLPKKTPSTKEIQEIKRRQERDGLIPDQGLNKSLKPIALTSTDDWGQKKAL